MTVIRPNGISGVTSITSSGDTINFYKSDGTLGPELGLNVNVNSGVSTFAALNVTGVLTYEDVTSVDSVGIITARSDLSIADKIIHTGDTNTAIRFPAADTITAETNGSEALRIDSSGRLLLGTTTEGYSTSDDLTIATSGSTGMTIRSGTSNYGSIHFSDATSGTGEYAGVIEYSHANDSLAFYTSATTRLTLDSSGRLLLGTTTEGHADADDLTLQAASGYTGLTLRSATDTGGAIYFSDATSGGGEYDGQIVYSQSSRAMTFATAGVTKLTLKSDGLLVPKGIQASANVTPTTGNGVEIFAATSSMGQIQAYDRDNSAWNDLVIKGETIQFYANSSGNNERMRITSSGYLGLGTNNPLVPFVLSHDGNQNIEMGYSTGSSSHYVQAYNRSTSAYQQLDLAGSVLTFKTPTEAMRIDGSGNVVIGNTSAFTGAQFTVDNGGSGDAVIALSRSGSGQNDVAIVNSAGEFVVKNGFASNVSSLTERMRLTANGVLNVGGDYTQTTSLVHLTGGNGGGGQSSILTLKHPNTTSTGDGPALFLDGYYSGNSWSFAKITSVNSGSGYGADLQIHVHPANGSQGASLVKAVSILGDGGSGANVTITDGNLKIGTSGHGIDFSAHGNASGMSSELLDDYEEGTWTATIENYTSSVTSSIINTTGYYTKVGNVVTCSWYSSVMSLSGSQSGAAQIGGLPFVSINQSEGYQVANFAHNNSFNHTITNGYTVPNQSRVVAVQNNSTQTSTWNTGGGNRYLMMQITYLSNT